MRQMLENRVVRWTDLSHLNLVVVVKNKFGCELSEVIREVYSLWLTEFSKTGFKTSPVGTDIFDRNVQLYRTEPCLLS